MSGSESVALVDATGRVVGATSRRRVRAENLLHSSSAVLVRDPAGRIYVHRRSPDKDWCPSAHDAAAGGVLQAGELPADSAVRELAEELGVRDVPLRPLLDHLYEDDTTRCFEHCYETTYDGPVTHSDGEVVWGAWMTLGALGALLRDPSWPFVPDTRRLLERLCRDGTADYAELGLGTGNR